LITEKIYNWLMISSSASNVLNLISKTNFKKNIPIIIVCGTWILMTMLAANKETNR